MVGLMRYFASAVLVAQGALASPTLATRGEGVHLFNCRPWGGAGVTQTWISIVVVCKLSSRPSHWLKHKQLNISTANSTSTAPTIRTVAS